MHVLTDQELYTAMMYARNINESDGQEILNGFHIEQPALAETIFNIFPALVAEKNRDMSNLFMDLCFDAICIYEHAFGKAAAQTEDWLVSQMEMLGTEFMLLSTANPSEKKKPIKVIQVKLLNIMKESIDDYASESPSRVKYIELTQNMMAATIQLLEKLHRKDTKKLH